MTGEQGKILVVDDNRLNRMKLALSLEQQGHTVGLAEDGYQALEALKSQPYDLVLLDILMPGMDGYHALESIKSDPALKDIPVIVISALDEIDSAVRCIEKGAEDYLPKPFNPVLLKARLDASLQKKKLRDLEKSYLQQELMLRQSEKLATLGRLSAGMAHELNNPAAAAQRGARQLQARFASLQQAHLKLGALDLSPAQLATLLALESRAQQAAKASIELEPLIRSDREADLEAALLELGLQAAWEVAPTLVSLGFNRAELAALSDSFNPTQIPLVIDWLDNIHVIYSLLEEINQGTSRISELVKALKAYSYMDQAPTQAVNIHEGLDNTLIILRSKLKSAVTVHRQYAPGLPLIQAYGSELNQVWTNLIDNAVDALDGAGEITLHTCLDGEWVVVEISDTGPGIPEAIIPHIFDPFFTTKPPGQGTGLGLYICHNIIVQKHHGRIDVHSQPGDTRFEIHLPLNFSSNETV
jgi:signal transduction histidine kinase